MKQNNIKEGYFFLYFKTCLLIEIDDIRIHQKKKKKKIIAVALSR